MRSIPSGSKFPTRSCLSPRAASEHLRAGANSTRQRSITSRPSNRDPAIARLPARYPLELISPKNDDSMNSTFGFRPAVDAQTGILTIHPVDAEPRGISTGDAVRLVNDRGECILQASVAPSVAEGVVCAPSVRWPKLCARRPFCQYADLPAPER